MTPYNTGKVKIGINYEPYRMNADEEMIQRVLIDKPPIEPEDIMAIVCNIVRLFFSVAAVCLMAGILYALLTHTPPAKPVPDCGSCRLYQQGFKK